MDVTRLQTATNLGQLLVTRSLDIQTMAILALILEARYFKLIYSDGEILSKWNLTKHLRSRHGALSCSLFARLVEQKYRIIIM